MLFNTFDFAIFLPIVFTLYWLLNSKPLTYQNSLILIASYLFYGWWDWRFLILIVFSTIVDFSIGLGLIKFKSRKKLLLLISIIVNIGFLVFFKYYNFFLSSFIDAFSVFGTKLNPQTLNIILPVGISFYTFQTLSYSIDVYRGKLHPTKDFIAFSAFVSFFPQLVAGPIERATNLLPQFLKKRSFNYTKATDGMRQILWGLFKKMVIADNCAEYVNIIFNNHSQYNGSTLLLGAVFFAFQIYGDFSGYSDIAIGTSRLFGFNLMQNFNFPYFSRNIAEFWRKWHISLSSWFKDYVYIPLGGSHVKRSKQIRNVFIIFIISGFWHGANWTFIIWGAIHSIYFIPLLLSNKNRNYLEPIAKNQLFPSLKDFSLMTITFGLTVLAWVFFRAENIGQASQIISSIFSSTLFTIPQIGEIKLIVVIALFLCMEWFNRESPHALNQIKLWPTGVRRLFYFTTCLMIVFWGGQNHTFIYFQF